MLSAFDETRTSQTTLEQIAELIRGGTYAPGDQLPSERQLAATLRVSRTSVREALRKLEAMGLVETRHGRGTFVRHPGAVRLQASLVPFIFAGREQIEKLFELREIIEVEAAGRAAGRATPAHLATMRHWLEAMEQHSARADFESVVIDDVEFHREIIRATGNDILVTIMDSIVDLLREMRRASPEIPGLQPAVIAGHRAILAAIQAGNPAAARQAMQDHLDLIRERMRDHWNQPSHAAATPASA